MKIDDGKPATEEDLKEQALAETLAVVALIMTKALPDLDRIARVRKLVEARLNAEGVPLSHPAFVSWAAITWDYALAQGFKELGVETATQLRGRFETYYLRDGSTTTRQEWMRRVDMRDYARVASDELVHPEHGRVWVSTVWVGIDHNTSGKGPPLFFETKVFKKGSGGPCGEDLDTVRYRSEDLAKAGHDAVVARLRLEGATGGRG